MVTATWLDLVFLLASYLGAALWVYRGWPRPQPEARLVKTRQDWPFVSIIVPARNEEKALPILLQSLKKLNYPSYEVIVVDDESTDRTRQIAKALADQVIAGEKRPEAWAGKPWACHQGAQLAKGEYLLFTDADTMHLPISLQKSVHFMETTRADLASAVPYHANRGAWARILGPFQALLFALTAPYQMPRKNRLFAIGQYLLFRRDYYQRSGGHVPVRDEFAEDLALAKHCLLQKANYRLHWDEVWYHVDMYETFGDFLRGWRRNFRQGMKHSGSLVFVETVLLIAALIGAGQWGQSAYAWLPSLLSLWVIFVMQKKLGRFSIWSVIFFPVGLLVFIWTSVGAAADRLLNRQLVWKQRSYVSSLATED
ncbi:MAG: glycosyltransferase [Oligoflexus sp.]